MSNPGVITLTEKEISPSKSFRVEDNLGEAVHFHYNDIRIDLTLKELMYIGKVCEETIYDLVKAKDFSMDDFDGDFLNEYSQCLMDLEKVEVDKVPVKELYVQMKNLIHLPVCRKMSSGMAKKILEKEKLYGKKREAYKVVLFNDDTVIMYGKEQVAELFLEDGEGQIEVLRMCYKKKKHSVSKHPWVPFLFKWNKKRLIKVAKKMAMKVLG